ncbi:hypothetical protein PoB_000636300 [Plakobranchus ocellatus]|uniref:Uncharacterized protein n=1 Tax=Plakobranchus ocellatus TaxID=259542 RepID=A0AAV3YBN4_9GAST|nr:hypothetical protein PoB_000636300 [Plakobranchus ocellatus]
MSGIAGTRDRKPAQTLRSAGTLLSRVISKCQYASGRARTRDRRVPSDLRADLLSTVPQMRAVEKPSVQHARAHTIHDHSESSIGELCQIIIAV